MSEFRLAKAICAEMFDLALNSKRTTPLKLLNGTTLGVV
jgi:hypothetical protein